MVAMSRLRKFALSRHRNGKRHAQDACHVGNVAAIHAYLNVNATDCVSVVARAMAEFPRVIGPV
jgi:hypothetical protein